MSRLRSIVVVGAIFCLVILPANTDAKKRSVRVTGQGPSLTLSTTNLTSPDGAKLSTLLTGRYQNGSKVLNLRALLSRTERLSYGGPPSILPPIGGTNSMSEGYEYEPDAESYHNDSEMSRSDGTVVMEAVYDYEDSTNRNMVYLTLNNVTFIFDLNTEEQINAVSDEDVENLNTWLNSEEGLLVRQAGVALVQYGQQNPTVETLLMYYVTAS